MEMDGIGVEEGGDVSRNGVVVDRIFGEADEESRERVIAQDRLSTEIEDDYCSCDERSRSGCPFLWDEEERNDLVIDRLFAVADERVYGRRRNRKVAGEMAEAAFLHKAMELGLVVSKPWGDKVAL